ncbi:MAG: cation diffusion facilitator family transporter [Bacillota bacterium]|nr:cation diffusion facilitator family transporter [Bacillota bacterium]
MLSEKIISATVGKNPDYSDSLTRTKIGSVTGLVGIGLNLSLTAFKAFIGLVTGSLSVFADAMNNLTDTVSSLVSLVGIRMAAKAKDEDHPYGHGRIEYVTTLIVSLGIIFVGASLLKTSVEGIIDPQPLKTNFVGMVVLVLSIGVKYWMYGFYKYIGNKIKSTTFKAVSIDSLGDVLVTSLVLLSYILSNFLSLPVDALGGSLVSIFILKSGYDLVKETISDIVGKGPNEEFVAAIDQLFKDRPYIKSTHDLQVYDFGHGNSFATIDALVDKNSDLLSLHRTFTEIEHEVLDNFGILLTIHMDVDIIDSQEDQKLCQRLDIFCQKDQAAISYHDPAVLSRDGKKHVLVHLVVDGDQIISLEEEKEKLEDLTEFLDQDFKGAEYNIILDRDYKDQKMAKKEKV